MSTPSSLLQIGPHAHIQGDATKETSYQQIIEKGSAKMLLADPPFCLLTRRGKKGQLRDPKRAKINHPAVKRYENIREYQAFTREWLSAACQYVATDGVLAIWSNFLGKKPIRDVALELGYKHFYGEFTWAKLSKEGGGNEILARIYEVALIFSKQPTAKITPQTPPTCWCVITHYDQEKSAERWGNHPNHKPYSVIDPLIRTYTAPGDRILDPFTGSGSTPAAAMQLQRHISGMELKEEWSQTTQDRMQNKKRDVQ